MGYDVSDRAAPVERYYSIEPAAYERTRLWLDARLGYGPGTGTMTCVAPLEAAPRSAAGRVLLAVWDFLVNVDAVAAVLPSLLASGVVQEITRAEYDEAMPKWVP